MAKAKEGLNADQLEIVRQKTVEAVRFFEHLSTAFQARIGAFELPPDVCNRKQLEEAAQYFQDTMENDLDIVFEELCAAVGIRYQAARDGATEQLST